MNTIAKEIHERRSASVKHFDPGNSRYRAVIYPVPPVHYQDAIKREFQEVAVSGAKGDGFVMGGWTEGQSGRLSTESGAQYGLGIRFYVNGAWSVYGGAFMRDQF